MLMKTVKSLPKVAGGYPFIGNLLSLDDSKIHQQLEQWSHQYGGIYRLEILGKDCVVVSDFKLLSHMLKNRLTPYNRPKGFVNALKSLKIDSLFTNVESEWYEQRRLVVESMNISKLRGVFSEFNDVTQVLIDRWSEQSKVGSMIDLNADVKRYAFDMLCNISLKYTSNSFAVEDPRLFEAVDIIFEALNKRAQQPIAFYKFYKTAFDKKVDDAVLIMVNHIQNVIDSHRGHAIDGAVSENIVQAMLLENSKSDNKMSEDQLVGNILLLVCAGLHTVGNTITWLTYHLAKYPEFQQQLGEEVLSYISKDGEPTEFSDFEKLPFMQAFIKESMRLRASAPLIFIQTDEDVILGNVNIPKGTDIYGLTGALGRSESEFDTPYEFQPSRWLNNKSDAEATEDANKKRHNAKAHMPFSYGATFCPGRNLAVFECQMFLFHVCRHFIVAFDPTNQPIKETYHIGVEASQINISMAIRP